MKKIVCVVHYNTPELTLAAIESVFKNSTDIERVVVFDNSDQRPFVVPDWISGKVEVIDNTKAQLIDFDRMLRRYPKRTDDGMSNFGSAKHCASVQCLIDYLREPFILMDSDILVSGDVSQLYYPNVAWCGKVDLARPDIRSKRMPRIVPFLCFINSPMLLKNGIRYFDGNRMILLNDRRVPFEYDTGASLLEDCRRFRLPCRQFDIDLIMKHYASGSWSRRGRTPYDFLFPNRDLFLRDTNYTFDDQKLKILVCCSDTKVKTLSPAESKFKTNIFCGKALYAGNDPNVQTMLGDDTGDNISGKNLQYNELTGVYWAWKNYDKIGNPDYIGLEHYRREFGRYMMYDYQSYDMVLWDNFMVKGICGKKQVFQQFRECHGERPINNLFAYIDQFQDGRYQYVKKMFYENVFHAKNMFIMKKDVFFEYCAELFPLILGMESRFIGNENVRDRSFISERVSSAIFDKLAKKYKVKYLRYPKCLP